MTFSPKQIEELSAKLDAAHVKPPPKGKYGSYIEGWHAIAEANRIFGFDGWSYRVDRLEQTNDTGYMALVTVEAGGVSRQDVGHGQGFQKGAGHAHESAIKEAVTDALKRALKSFGNPFGLALYDKTQENVERSNGSTRPKDHGGAGKTTVNPAFIQQQQADDYIRLINAAETLDELQALWADIGPKVAGMSGSWRETITTAKDQRKAAL